MLKLLTLVFLILAGCASAPPKNVISTSSKSITALDGATAKNLSAKTVGDTVLLNNERYTVTKNYRAASGRDCKKLLAADKTRERIVCQTGSGQWYQRKALTSPAMSEQAPAEYNSLVPSIVPATDPEENLVPQPVIVIDEQDLEEVRIDDITTDDPDVVAQRSFALRPNENLWRFSKRVTGNANNWQKIARYNRVEKVATLRAGDRIAIPTNLPVRTDGG